MSLLVSYGLGPGCSHLSPLILWIHMPASEAGGAIFYSHHSAPAAFTASFVCQETMYLYQAPIPRQFVSTSIQLVAVR